MEQPESEDPLTDPPTWGPRLVAVIAGEVRRHRKAQGMSAQRLADRCTELGWPIPRSVLANLESGYRETITVPELFTLAQALGVPPIRLLIPLGHVEKVEILPGAHMLTTDAMHWLRGEGSPFVDFETDDPTVADFVTHHAEVSRWSWAVDLAASIRAGEMEGTEQDAERHEAEADRARQHIQRIRHTMRERGLTPPPVPPRLRLEEARS